MNHYLFLPETYDPLQHPYGWDIALLLHIICFRYFTDKRYHKGDEVPLKTSYLQEIIHSSKLKKILTYCEQNHIININHKYIVGGKSRSYSIGHEYLNIPIINYFVKLPKIINKIEKLKNNQRKRDRANFNSTHKYLMNVVENRIDYGNILSLLPEHINYFVSLREDTKKNPVEQYECLEKTIFRISRQEYTGKIDKNGRFYSPITELQSEMRSLLRLDGSPIIFQDISHTHPLLLTILLRDIADNRSALSTADGSTSTNRSALSTELAKNFYLYTNLSLSTLSTLSLSTLSTLSLSIHHSLMKCTFEDEIARFGKLVSLGNLYTMIATDLNLPLEKVKKQVLSFFYDKPRSSNSCQYTKWFESKFFMISQFLKYVKKDDHRFISNYLLQIESNIVINTICRDLINDWPKIPLVTVHDSIGTTAKYSQIVYDKMVKEFNRLGVNVNIKEKS